MQASTLRTGRWIVGGVVFFAAATVLFEAAGQSSPRPAAVRAQCLSRTSRPTTAK